MFIGLHGGKVTQWLTTGEKITDFDKKIMYTPKNKKVQHVPQAERTNVISLSASRKYILSMCKVDDHSVINVVNTNDGEYLGAL